MVGHAALLDRVDAARHRSLISDLHKDIMSTASPSRQDERVRVWWPAHEQKGLVWGVTASAA